MGEEIVVKRNPLQRTVHAIGRVTEPVELAIRRDIAEREATVNLTDVFGQPRLSPQSTLSFEERFEIEERIGGGTAGDAFLGVDTVTGERVAVKYLRDTVGANDIHLARTQFRREVEFPRRLNHSSVVPVIASHERPHPDAKKQTQFIVVMPFVDQPTLEQKLSEGKKFSVDETVSYLRQMGDLAVHMYAEGVIHRDIHPGNVFAMRDGIYKVTDFGMARNMSTVIGSQHATKDAGNAHRIHYRDYSNIKGIVDEKSDLITITRTAIAMLRGTHYDKPIGEDEFLTIPANFRKFLLDNSGETDEIVSQDAKAYVANLEKALQQNENKSTRRAKITKTSEDETSTAFVIKQVAASLGGTFVPSHITARYRSGNKLGKKEFVYPVLLDTMMQVGHAGLTSDWAYRALTEDGPLLHRIGIATIGLWYTIANLRNMTVTKNENWKPHFGPGDLIYGIYRGMKKACEVFYDYGERMVGMRTSEDTALIAIKHLQNKNSELANVPIVSEARLIRRHGRDTYEEMKKHAAITSQALEERITNGAKPTEIINVYLREAKEADALQSGYSTLYG